MVRVHCGAHLNPYSKTTCGKGFFVGRRQRVTALQRRYAGQEGSIMSPDDDSRLRRCLETKEDLDAMTQEELRREGITDVLLEKQLRQFVLSQGSAFSRQTFPRETTTVQPLGECFRLSILLSMNAELTYVEGFALSQRGTPAFHHAWCEDSLGGIVDCTWANTGLAYFGLRFPSDYVEQRWDELRVKFCCLKEYSLLDGYRKQQRRTH